MFGEIPKHIAIFMMDNDSYNGNYTRNPFNFQHYNLTQIGTSVNGEEVPFKPLKLNFDDKLFVTVYSTLFSGTGKLHGNSGSIIKREDYSEGYTIIVADLTPFEIGDNFDYNMPRACLLNRSPVIAMDLKRNRSG